MANNPHNAVHISEAIRELLKSQNLKPRFDEASVVVSWEKVVGKAIAKRTRRIYIRNKVLFIELQSPSMKHDLSYHKVEMLNVIKKEFGNDVISEIVLM